MNPNPNTQVAAPAVKKPADVRSYIQSDVVKNQLKMVLPKTLNADVMARVVCTAILKTPRLAECRIESLMQSILLLSQFGMLPDGRSAHLIPYYNTKAGCYDCQALIDWKGKVSRATDNGVENISADVVYHNDKFEWSMTMDGLKFNHQPDWRNPDRGAMFAAYCVWRIGGKFSGVIMSKLEIDNIRKRSKSPDKGPWETDYNEMAKKTLVHRASKLWPLDAKFREAIEVQEVNSPTIDLPALPVVEEEKEPAKAVEAPKPLVQETPRQYVTRLLTEKAVAFNAFVAYVETNNICELGPEAASWENLDAVPDAIFAALADDKNPKLLANLLKKK
jgi:recombination protein RecT